MADPVRRTDHDAFVARADQALAEADAATLGNVRERCLRAEAVWREMARKAEYVEKMRADSLASKQA